MKRPDISIVVDGARLGRWADYRIVRSMLTGIDTFELAMPFHRRVWDLTAPNRPVQVLVDETPIINGFLDDSDLSADGETISVGGRSKTGWLLQDCLAGLDFSGLTLHEMIRQAAAPMFNTVTFANARNRNIVRGKGKKARAGSEPLKIATRKKVSTRIEPGQTRWQVIASLCEQAGYLAWSSADGKELFVGLPNYDQEPQFRFFRAAPGSTRSRETNVNGLPIRRSAGDRYSRVICVGAGQGTDANYGARVGSRYGVAKNNPATNGGEGIDFPVPRTLIVQRAVASTEEANEFAAAEMARRDSQGHIITVESKDHGQVIAGRNPTWFATDVLSIVEDERSGTRGIYTIVSCTFASSRQRGETTEMQLMRKGSDLSR